MKISAKHSQGSGTAEHFERMSDFLNLVVAELNLPSDHITDVIVADEDHFGAAVEELSPGAGFTDDGVYLAVGKTFHRLDATGAEFDGLAGSVCWHRLSAPMRS